MNPKAVVSWRGSLLNRKPMAVTKESHNVSPTSPHQSSIQTADTTRFLKFMPFAEKAEADVNGISSVESAKEIRVAP